MRSSKGRGVTAGSMLRGSRFEIIPMSGVVEEAAYLPAKATVTVTGSPRKGIDSTLDLSEQLSGLGFHIIPHIMARLVRSHKHLAEILDRLSAARLDEVFVIGGDVPSPAGPYDSSGALIEDMVQMPNRPGRLGIAAYPEGHPLISNTALFKALQEKQPYVDYMVTQICFDASLIFRWLAGMRSQGISLPVYLGIPGVLKRSKLLEISLRVGVGQSTRFLTNHAGMIARLLKRDIYNPESLVLKTLQTAHDSSMNISGFHIYTFNQCQSTEHWRQKILKTQYL